MSLKFISFWSLKECANCSISWILEKIQKHNFFCEITWYYFQNMNVSTERNNYIENVERKLEIENNYMRKK